MEVAELFGEELHVTSDESETEDLKIMWESARCKCPECVGDQSKQLAEEPYRRLLTHTKKTNSTNIKQ